MSATPGLSVVVPYLNESKLLEEMVGVQLRELQALGVPHELILVDDASHDDSPAIAARLAAEHQAVRTLRHTVNQGAGGGFRTGAFAARLDLIILVPVDNPLDREQLQGFLNVAQDHDVVCGCRTRREGYSPLLAAASRSLQIMLRYGLGLPRVNDYTWIFLLRREVLPDVDWRERRVLFLPEILKYAQRRGLRIAQRPCPMRARTEGQGTIGRPSAMARTFGHLVRLIVRLRVLRNQGEGGTS